MATSPRDTFLRNLSQWAFDVPYATQWAVQFNPVAGLSNLLGGLQHYTTIDVDQFAINNGVLSKLTNSSVMGEADNLGLHFAQAINAPSEGFSPVRVGIEESGGFLKGAVGGDRMGMSEKIISIDMLETNLDFIDGVIRPWVIAASYRGLIERSDVPSIKCTILLSQYSKGPNRPRRKLHQFHGCVPMDVVGTTLDYDNEKLFKRTVKWVYNHYTYELFDNV